MQKHVSRRNVMVTSCALAGALALGLTVSGARPRRPARCATSPSVAATASEARVLPVDTSNLLCLRSTVNYPHVIADRTGAASRT